MPVRPRCCCKHAWAQRSSRIVIEEKKIKQLLGSATVVGALLPNKSHDLMPNFILQGLYSGPSRLQRRREKPKRNLLPRSLSLIMRSGRSLLPRMRMLRLKSRLQSLLKPKRKLRQKPCPRRASARSKSTLHFELAHCPSSRASFSTHVNALHQRILVFERCLQLPATSLDSGGTDASSKVRGKSSFEGVAANSVSSRSSWRTPEPITNPVAAQVLPKRSVPLDLHRRPWLRHAAQGWLVFISQSFPIFSSFVHLQTLYIRINPIS